MFFAFKFRTVALAVALFFLVTVTGFAQTSADVTKLVVELWPEYDRPEVLVIHRVELNEEIPLPAQVSFNFPGYIDDLHAVAYKEDGNLLSVAPADITLQNNGDVLQLSFPAISHELHFEYYDPQILTVRNDARLLEYGYMADYAIADADFRVQEPNDSEEFNLSPRATNTHTGMNGQFFQIIETGEMSPGDAFGLTASYMRSAAGPAVAPQQQPAPPPVQVITEDSPAVEIPSTSSALGYILIGGGVLLLIGVGGYWLYTSRSKKTETRRPPATSKPARRKKPQATPPPVQKSAPEEEPSGGYCYQCGTALRADASFCHVCGARRRE